MNCDGADASRRYDAPQILAEMIRIARPDGIVASQKPDASAWACDPPHPAFDVLREEIINAYRRTGNGLSIGRRAARMLRDVRKAD